jgi:hypothetical protein
VAALVWSILANGHLSEFLTDLKFSALGDQVHSILYKIIYNGIVFETSAVYTGDALG